MWSAMVHAPHYEGTLAYFVKKQKPLLRDFFAIKEINTKQLQDSLSAEIMAHKLSFVPLKILY